jgi:uncharacterized membrane protein YccC
MIIRLPPVMLPIFQQFTWRDGLFSLKAFIAAMLALFIAFRLDLSQPSWCITTVYVVSQPLAGMVLAKSLYRVLGTIIGAVMSLIFVALFSNSPELFCLALAIWIGVCTSVAVYLRDAPQAYAGVLAGYSAAIIGLPAALTPNIALDFAIARCLEIMLGIACGTLLHHVVFPRRAGDALRKALYATLPNMARWAGDALHGLEGEAKGLIDRKQIIAAVVSLDLLRVFGSLDTPEIRSIDSVIRLFEGKLLSLLALLVSVYDRLTLLQRDQPRMADALRPLVERTAAHIAGSADAATPQQALEETGTEAALLAAIESQLPPPQALRSDPDAFLVRSVLLRLRDVLAMWHEAVWLRTHISAGIRPPDAAAAPAFQPFRDIVFAVLVGGISTVTVLAASAFWIFTAWPNGPTAITYAGVICAIMGARDDPAAAAAGFLKMSVIGALVAGFYLVAVLPALSTFTALVVALAPFYLACGLLLSAPTTAPLALAVIFVGGGLLSISNAMSYDFADFLNNGLSYMVGIGIGGIALRLLRPLGNEWVVRRLTRGMMLDLARVAASGMAESRTAFESLMFDRINALLMRLDPMVDADRAVMQGSFAGLRVGLNILMLRRDRAALPPAAAPAVERALGALAEHFGRANGYRPAATPLPLLRAARDCILALDEDALLTPIAEWLYNIETTLRQHPTFFGLRVPVRPAQSAERVTA